MELVLKQKLRKIFFIFAIVICSSTPSFAAWQGPVVVVALKWGNQVGEVAIKYSDTQDIFPTNIAVGQDRLVIPDKGNGRVYIYSLDGKLIQIFTPVKYRYSMVYDPRFIANHILLKGKDDYMLYDYKGKLANSFKGAIYIKELAIVGGNIFVYNYRDKQYYQYSPTGELLNTYTARPLCLGIVKNRSLGDKRYRATIKYPDKTYEIKHKIAGDEISRDNKGNLYVVKRIVNYPVPNPFELKIGAIYSIDHYKVFVYDYCDTSLLYGYDFPINRRKVVKKYDTLGEARTEAIEEYGQPVISPNGNVYCWERTPDTYSILKWIWVKSPDAPVNLMAAVTSKTVSLTWEPPQHDTKTIIGYEILRSTDVCNGYKPIGNTNANTFVFEDKKITEENTYYYQVNALKKKGISRLSNKAVAVVE